MAANDRERLINRFILRIFKGKALGLSKPVVSLKLRKFLKTQNKKWTSALDDLFESTWEKKVPSDILAKFKKETTPKIKPNKVFEKPSKEGKEKKSRLREDNSNEPEDIDNPIYNEPEFKLTDKKRQCANCGETFIQNQEYPNRLLCPKCSSEADKIFRYNNVYASAISEYKDITVHIKKKS